GGRHTRFSRDWSSDVCSSDLVEEHCDAHAGVARVDVRPAARFVAKAIADGILDAQGREVEAAQRRADGVEVDTDTVAHIEMPMPCDIARDGVDVVLGAVRRMSDAQQDACGDAAFQICAKDDRPVAAKAYAAAERFRFGGAESSQFIDEYGFESARPGGEQMEGGHAAAATGGGASLAQHTERGRPQAASCRRGVAYLLLAAAREAQCAQADAQQAEQTRLGNRHRSDR